MINLNYLTLEDTYKHKGLRKQLVKIIKEKGIKNQRVIEAIAKVPRHFFFDKIFHHYAYKDQAFPIAAKQTISQPYTVAFQTELLDAKEGENILEIGTGSGYQACVLLEMGAEVYTIEYQRELYLKAIRFLPSIGYQPHIYYGDGSKGMSRFAPYDGIIVTAGAPSVPKELLQQLKIGGRLVIPVGDKKKQSMMRIEKVDEDKFVKHTFMYFTFVPLLGKNGVKQ